MKTTDSCRNLSFSGGDGEIRTLEPLLTVTRFPIVRARPATRHLHAVDISVVPCSRTTLIYYKFSSSKNQVFFEDSLILFLSRPLTYRSREARNNDLVLPSRGCALYGVRIFSIFIRFFIYSSIFSDAL